MDRQKTRAVRRIIDRVRLERSRLTEAEAELPFSDTHGHWRWRWVQAPGRYDKLHRVKAFKRVGPDDDIPALFGVATLCGLRWKRVTMPGLFSRMGAPRCKKCCAAIGLPPGAGNPFNEGHR